MSDDDHQLKAQLLALNQGPPPVVKDAPATGWYSNVKTNKSRATAPRDAVGESISSRRVSELFGVSKRESFGEVYGGEIDDDDDDDDVSGIV